MITLRKNADKRVRRGHLWVFSNEIAEPAVASLEPGSIHELRDAAGEFIGMVYANPAALIAARILSRRRILIDSDFLRMRLETAYEYRRRLFPDRDTYRVVFSEADKMPGLIVDRYRDTLVVQSLTAGMDRMKADIVQILVELFEPECVFLRNDSPMRALEGLEPEKAPAYGVLPEELKVELQGLTLRVDVVNGQKTGLFLDQEANRTLVRQFVFPGARVLDLFSYTGSWGLHAALQGAAEVTMVDSSQPALDRAREIAALNGLEDRITFMRDSVQVFLKRERAEWDMVILDPPAFIKSRAHITEGHKGYIDINRRALGKLAPGGIIVTCSCSHHLDQGLFEETLDTAARQSGKNLRVLAMGGQGPDHPYLLSMPETKYLKLIVAQAI